MYRLNIHQQQQQQEQQSTPKEQRLPTIITTTTTTKVASASAKIINNAKISSTIAVLQKLQFNAKKTKTTTITLKQQHKNTANADEAIGNMTSDLNGLVGTDNEQQHAFLRHCETIAATAATPTTNTTAIITGGNTNLSMATTIDDKLKLLSAIKAEPLLLHDVNATAIGTATPTHRGKQRASKDEPLDMQNIAADLTITKVTTTSDAGSVPLPLSGDTQLSNSGATINLCVDNKSMDATHLRPFATSVVVLSGDSSDSASNGQHSYEQVKRARLESPKNWLPTSSPGGAHNSAPSLSPSPASQSQNFSANMTNEYASPMSAGSYEAFSPNSKAGRDDLSPSSSLNGYATNDNCEAKKSKKGPAPRLQEELCLVCGDRASGYHYNALTCEGCKGFFRRSVTKNANYCCKFGHACEMDMYMRRKCQECRLKKCLAVGMRPECVVPENQCAMKRREKKAQKEKDKQQASPMSNPSDMIKKEILDLMTCEPPTHPTFPLLPDDILAKCQARNIPSLTHNQLSVIYKLIWYQDGYEQPSEEDLKRIMSSPDENESQHDMSFRHITEITILTVQLIVEFAKGLPAFTRIPQEDQITLLKACSSEVMMLRMARRYDHSTDSIFFANNRSYNRDTYKMAGVADNIEDLLHFCRQMYAMKVDNVEYALLTAIVIFSDRPGLEEAELVEAIQNYYIDTLRIYILNRHCGDPKSLVFFAKLLSILTELRTLGNQNAEMCFSLKLKNRKLPKFLEEIWDVHTIPPSVQSHIQATGIKKTNELAHQQQQQIGHTHQQHTHAAIASTSAEAVQQSMLHNIKMESSPSMAPTNMSLSSGDSPLALNGSEYSDVSPGLPMLGMVLDQDNLLGGDSGAAA